MSSSWEQRLRGAQRTEGAMARQAQAIVLGFLKQGRAGEVVLLLRWPDMRSVREELHPGTAVTTHALFSQQIFLTPSPQPAALPINERTN